MVTRVAKSAEEVVEQGAGNRVDIQINNDCSGIDRKVGSAAVLQRTGGPIRELHYHVGKLNEHIMYNVEEIRVLLGLHMLWFEKEIGEARLALDNQAIIVALYLCKLGSAQYLTDEIL